MDGSQGSDRLPGEDMTVHFLTLDHAKKLLRDGEIVKAKDILSGLVETPSLFSDIDEQARNLYESVKWNNRGEKK